MTLLRRIWRDVVCFVRDHDWHLLAVCDLGHACKYDHPMAGCLAICRRCNLVWNDLHELKVIGEGLPVARSRSA